jgi:hypothetical protein
MHAPIGLRILRMGYLLSARDMVEMQPFVRSTTLVLSGRGTAI